MLLEIQGIAGTLALLLIAWLLSEKRSAVSLRTVSMGLIMQLCFALLLLKLPIFQGFFLFLNQAVLALQEATQAGTSFVFGYIGGGNPPFDETQPGNSFILAFRALPMVLVISALSALLYHWRILPLIVEGFSWLLCRTLRLGGAIGLGTASNVFVGMVEAPLFIKPYLAAMSRGELFILMVTGMATISGTMMALYASILSDSLPNVIGHILTASLISAPAAVTIAHIMIPDNSMTGAVLNRDTQSANSMDAITRGTIDGMRLLANIIVMLVVLVALVHLANLLIGLLPHIADEPITLQRILGWLLSPLAWLLGIPWHEAQTAGALLGTKTVLNEFLAYLQLAQLPAEALSERSTLIMTYALCGFANFGSVGIMIGGIGAMCPQRRNEIVALGIKSIIAGTLATCMTGAIAGVVISF